MKSRLIERFTQARRESDYQGLIDAIPYNQVRGLPFTSGELESMLEEVVKNA